MNNFEQMMEELKKEYVESLPTKIAEIAIKAEENNVQDLREHFHRLKGTGKTYGIPEISELGEVFEKLCLNRPQEALTLVTDALGLLRTIHTERSAARAFNLASDQRFSRLKAKI